MLIVAGPAAFIPRRPAHQRAAFKPYSEAALRLSASGDDSRSTLPPPASMNPFPF